MKVLHITNAFPYSEYNSYGIFIKEQIDSLEKLGIENDVFFINAKKFGYKEYIRALTMLNGVIEESRPDLIHCHHELSLLSTLLNIKKQPKVLSLLGDIQKRSKLNQIIFRLVRNRAQGIIVKNKLQENFHYIPNGVNLDFFKPIDKIEAKTRLNLSSGTNYVLFVTASLNNPIKRYDKFQSILEGMNGHEKIFEPLVMSGVTRSEVPFYFNSCDLLLLTSDHEGSPNAVKEAMACNLPIVSTDVGNVKELFGESKGNFVSPSGTVEEMVALSLKASASSKSEGRDRLEYLGLEINNVAKEIHKVYNDLLK